MKAYISVAALALVFAMVAPAQVLSGSLSGSVADSSGQLIPSAAVTLTSEVSHEQRSATTNETADFVFPGLAPGVYTIRVEAKGFKTLEQKGNVVLAAGRTAVGRLQMEVGAVSESITVTARGAEVATTTTSQQAVLDNKQIQMIGIRGRDLMLMLHILPGVEQGSAQPAENDNFGGTYAQWTPNIQGRTAGNTFYVDGVNSGDGGGGDRFVGATNLDAIAEVNVQLGAYPAEYGLKGAAQLNIVTKRGGDEFHGTGYWYKRHEQFNANSWLNNKNSLPKARYRYSTLGGNLGGRAPVKIPILNPTGHGLFFFYSVDDTQIKRVVAVQRWTLPTALERAGNFSQSRTTGGALIVVTDPLNNNGAFPGNIIPSQRANAFGVAHMNVIKLPNYAGQCQGGSSGCNFLFQEPSPDHPRRQHLYRFDVRPTDKDTFSVKHQTWYTKIGTCCEGTTATGSGWGLYRQEYDFTNDLGYVSYTKIFSPHIVNELSATVMYDTEYGQPIGQENYDALSRVKRGLGGLGQFAPVNNPFNFMPTATFGSLPNNSFSAANIAFDNRTPNVGADSAWAFSDNLTYMRGAHTFKLGAMREFERFGQARASVFAGNINYQNDSNDPGTTGYAFANAYIGHVQTYTEGLGRPPNNRIQVTWAAFAQDTWKVRKNLTLDIGLRIYKWSPPLNASHACVSGVHFCGEASEFTFERYDPTWGGKPPILFRPTSTPQGRRAQNPLTGEILPIGYVGMMVPGTGYNCTQPITAKAPCLFNGIVTQDDGKYLQNGSRGFVDWLPLQFDPRLGVAWDVFGDGRMAVRAGLGVYHDGTGGSFYEGGPAYNFTKSVLFTDLDSFLSSSSATNPISVSGAWRKGAKRPVNYNYILGIQKQLPWQTVLDVAYVGTSTHHNLQSWNFNALPAGVRFLPSSQDSTAPGKPLPDVFLRPILGWGDISIAGPATSSRYDSLQVQATRRFVGGIEMAGVFTYAGGTSNGWNQHNPLPSSMARSRNLVVQQLVFNMSYVVDIPHGSKLIKLRGSKWVLDNWQFSGVSTLSNGALSNVGLSTTDNFDFTGGGESCGVVQTGNAMLPHGQRTVDQWFNTSVFQRPSGRGDLGTNCNNAKFRLPGFNNHDWSLFKNFPVREKKVLQLRWEIYNVFNHTQFMSVNTTATFNPAGQQTNANFGKVTDARTERRMQLALRFTF